MCSTTECIKTSKIKFKTEPVKMNILQDHIVELCKAMKFHIYSMKLSKEELCTRMGFPSSVATAVAITLQQSKVGFRINISLKDSISATPYF